MTLKDFVLKLQRAINAAGGRLTEDGQFGAKTLNAAEEFEIEIVVKPKKVEDPGKGPAAGIENPAYLEAKKHAGKTEHQSAFNRYLSAFWGRVGLPGYKTIIGTSFAWCGLFIAAMNSEVGQEFISNGAGARNWSQYGVAVDWKRDGIPKGSVLVLNHAGNCSTAKGNHVTFADGDCSASDLAKPKATVPGFGGNQGDTVKRSNYSVREVCNVRWPKEIPKPGPVNASRGCAGASSSGESTR